MTTTLAPLERDRAKIADTYKWNLADVYADAVEWRARKEALAAELPGMRAFEGRLGSSPATLADALELMTRLDKELSRLYVYASMVADEDARLAEPQGMQQEMQNLYAAFGAQAAFVEPELLRVGAATIERFLDGEPRLALFAFLLRDVVRRAAHTLSDAEEKLLADASPLASSATNIYTILSNADFPYPTITISSGETVSSFQKSEPSLR